MDFVKVNKTIGDLVKHEQFGEGIVVRLNMSGPIVLWYNDDKQFCVPDVELEYADNPYCWYQEGYKVLRIMSRAIDWIGDRTLRQLIDTQITKLHRIGLGYKYDDLEPESIQGQYKIFGELMD